MYTYGDNIFGKTLRKITEKTKRILLKPSEPRKIFTFREGIIMAAPVRRYRLLFGLFMYFLFFFTAAAWIIAFIYCIT